jgi:hypothetical protein
MMTAAELAMMKVEKRLFSMCRRDKKPKGCERVKEVWQRRNDEERDVQRIGVAKRGGESLGRGGEPRACEVNMEQLQDS